MKRFLIALALIVLVASAASADDLLFKQVFYGVDLDSLTTGVAQDSNSVKLIFATERDNGLVTRATVLMQPDTVTGTILLQGRTYFTNAPAATSTYMICEATSNNDTSGVSTLSTAGAWYMAGQTVTVKFTSDTEAAVHFTGGANYVGGAPGFFAPYFALYVVSSTSLPTTTKATVTVYLYGERRNNG